MLGCGGAADASAPSAATCDGRELVFETCSGCHDGAQPETGGLDLRSPELAVAALVGRPAAGAKCAATGRVLVAPDGTGLLVDKLGPSPPCGDRMPQGTWPLTTEELSCVDAWVAEVARRPEE